MAAAALFFSGALIGGTLGRASVWLLPGQVAPPPSIGQISRALEPHDVAAIRPVEKAAARWEETAKAQARLPEVVAAPSASQENAARESETAASARPPAAQTTGASAPVEAKPEAAAVLPPPPPPAPRVRLLNPGAVQQSPDERPNVGGTRAAKEKAAAQEESNSRRRRERRAASTDGDAGATGPERDSRRNYRSLREEMLRRER